MPKQPPPDLDALERAAFRKFHEDGLLDVFLGLLLALMPLSALLSGVVSESVSTLIYAATLIVLVVALSVLRPRLVRPRLGSFTPSRARRQKIRWTRLFFVASFALGLLVWAIFAAGEGEGMLAIMPFVWLVNCVVVFGAAAYFLEIPRLLLYGLLFGGPLAIDGVIRMTTEARLPLVLTFVLPGLIIVTIGLVKLVRFLRDYPLPSPEGDGGLA